MNDIILSLGSMLGGVILSIIAAKFFEKRKFKRELETLGNISVDGNDWIAAWQTSINGVENINFENIIITQKGGTVSINNLTPSPENPEGGYLWSGQLQFHNSSSLLGWYSSIKSENSTARGIIYFIYNPIKKVFVGVWIGSSFDGPLMGGVCAISKSKEKAMKHLEIAKSKFPGPIRIVESWC